MFVSRFIYVAITLGCLLQLCDGLYVSDRDIMIQFKFWLSKIKKHLVYTEDVVKEFGGTKRLIEGETELDYYLANKEAILGNYRKDVCQKILPHFLDFLQQVNYNVTLEQTAGKSKWTLIGTGIKLLIGISLMHGALAIDSLEDLRKLFNVGKGVDDTYHASIAFAKDSGLWEYVKECNSTYAYKKKGKKADACKDMIDKQNERIAELMSELETTCTAEEFANGTEGQLEDPVRGAIDELIRRIPIIILEERDEAYHSYRRATYNMDKSDNDVTHWLKQINHKMVNIYFKDLRWDHEKRSVTKLLTDFVRKLAKQQQEIMNRLKLSEKRHRRTDNNIDSIASLFGIDDVVRKAPNKRSKKSSSRLSRIAEKKRTKRSTPNGIRPYVTPNQSNSGGNHL